jgi:ABC-type dipeptide/oligopeptide/nickel transport system permease component
LTAYITRRAALVIPTLLGMLTVVFILMRVIPGDPVRLMLGVDVDQATVDATRHAMGLDRPIPVQYKDYILQVLRGDFGRSLTSRRLVSSEVARHFRNTAVLGLLSAALAAVIGLALGVLAACYKNSTLDYLSVIVAVLGISTPSYFTGILLILLFAVKLQWLPAGSAGSFRHLILPALTLAAGSTSIIARMTRSSLVEELQRDYVRTAVAKGLTRQAATLRHALRNALIPAVTTIGLEFGFVLGGSVLVETVFSYPGIGWLIMSAISQRDFPLVQGAIIVVALTFVLINFLTDVSYAFLDPRIRY